MRALAILPAACLLARLAQAQASVASDLWRVASGTLVVPLSLDDAGTAPIWTPAVSLAPGENYRFGLEGIHSPSEIGVNGGMFAFSARAPGLGIISVTYGRLSIGDVSYTETSPEAIGTIAIYNQSGSIGLSGRIARNVTGGIAVRFLSGELGFADRRQFGLDFGGIYATTHFRLGATTRFFDPTFGAASGASSYNAGAEYRTSTFDAWGTRARLLLRYGVTAAEGEAGQQLITAGLVLSDAFTFDAGVSSERASGDSVLRNRLGVAFGTGPFRIQIGRDGGVNGFGATYRFGLTGVFR